MSDFQENKALLLRFHRELAAASGGLRRGMGTVQRCQHGDTGKRDGVATLHLRRIIWNHAPALAGSSRSKSVITPGWK